MIALYPLRFEHVFRRYLWGGRRLGEVLGKPIGAETDYAESWEVVDHGDDQSVIADGPLKGSTLHDLMVNHAPALLGRHHDEFAGKRFPLLFKYLDANEKLSVQVHPDDAAAAKQTPPDLGKTEAWVILHAKPGSYVYAGLKRGFDRAALAREVERGTTELCLHRYEPQAGDCIFVPAGVVHALGPGLLVAEIQQASNTTFRLFDWNRTGADGRPRALHIDAALAAINYQMGPVQPQPIQVTHDDAIARLVECDKFVLDRWRFDARRHLSTDNRFQILSITRGRVTLIHQGQELSLETGQTLLIPASIPVVELRPKAAAEMLVMYLP